MERDHPQRTLEKEKMKDLGGSGLSWKRTAASFSSTHRAPGHCVRGAFPSEEIYNERAVERKEKLKEKRVQPTLRHVEQGFCCPV